MKVPRPTLAGLLFVIVTAISVHAETIITPFTTTSGDEVFSSWSPDSESIAFVSTRGGRLDIWMDRPGPVSEFAWKVMMPRIDSLTGEPTDANAK